MVVGRAERGVDPVQPLQDCLRHVLQGDSLVARKLRAAGLAGAEDIKTTGDLARLPFTDRDELIEDQTRHPPYGTNLGEPLAAYTEVRQTAGSDGPPLRWLETPASLAVLGRLYARVLRSIGVGPSDQVLHTSGPGTTADDFWAAAHSLGALSLRTRDATKDILTFAGAVLICTPTEALRLAHQQPGSGPRLIVLCGETGGCVASTRRVIRDGLGAATADVYATTEAGAIGWECPAAPGTMHLNTTDLIVELVDEAGAPAPRAGELVVTSLTRWSMPLVRYRSGDLARMADEQPCGCGSSAPRFEGGVLGRVDERVTVRGTNLLPAAIENVVRRHPAVREFALRAFLVHGSAEVSVQIEPQPAIASEGDLARVAAEVGEDLRRSLGVRVACDIVAPGSLSAQAVGRRPRKFNRQ